MEEDSGGNLKVQNISSIVAIEALAEALEFNRALRSANLAYNDIGDEGRRALALSLRCLECFVFSH